MKLCLFEPEIPQNAGSMARLCACFDVELHIIEPASFLLHNKKFIRAGMDYLTKIEIKKHCNFQEFQQNHNGRIVLLDIKATTPYYDFSFLPTDCIMVGKESTGVPDNIFCSCIPLLIPMKDNVRSLNVAMSAAIVVSEAIKQLSTK